MVRLASGAFKAVVVEEVTESRSLVVKKLGAYVGKIGGVIGATILGDGGVAPVIDLPDLLGAADADQALGQGSKAAQGSRIDSTFLRQTSSSALRALVVDDSISARRTTAQLIRDAGFEVQTAIDGLDAVAILDKAVPDVIITDMEMPRMNGLELTGHVRARDATKHIPVIMITSRSTEKHRQQAEAKGVEPVFDETFQPGTAAQAGWHLGGERRVSQSARQSLAGAASGSAQTVLSFAGTHIVLARGDLRTIETATDVVRADPPQNGVGRPRPGRAGLCAFGGHGAASGSAGRPAAVCG